MTFCYAHCSSDLKLGPRITTGYEIEMKHITLITVA